MITKWREFVLSDYLVVIDIQNLKKFWNLVNLFIHFSCTRMIEKIKNK